MSRPRPIYLIDFACYQPDDELKLCASHFTLMYNKDGTTVDYVPPVFKKGCIKEETNQTRKDRNMDFLFALRVNHTKGVEWDQYIPEGDQDYYPWSKVFF
ncbi:very-long-chain 3-oxoacyl-CoA synthase [Trifolium repens]|nr:very-long-chain 3-oxoacyl-CoA synthase [Trifolium repens]